MSVELFVFSVRGGEPDGWPLDTLSKHFENLQKTFENRWQLSYDFEGELRQFDLSVSMSETDNTSVTALCFEKPQRIEPFLREVFNLMLQSPCFAVMPESAYVITSKEYLADMPKDIQGEIVVAQTFDDFIAAF